LVVPQVFELLEHEQPPLLLACLPARHRVGLAGRASVVDIAGWQPGDVDLVEIPIDARRAVLSREDASYGLIAVETAATDAAEILERERESTKSGEARVVREEGGRVDESAAEGGQLVVNRGEVRGSSASVGSRMRRLGTDGTLSGRPTDNVGRASARRYLALAAWKRGCGLAVLQTALGLAAVAALFLAAALLDVDDVEFFFSFLWRGGAEGYTS
jgi:hypothetical protein